MRARPPDAERVKWTRARHAAVTAHLAEDARAFGRSDARAVFFVGLSATYRKRRHPVLGVVDVDEAIGVRADYYDLALMWVKHWLGRSWTELVTYDEFVSDSSSWPHGCPRMWDVPAARHYVHTDGGRIVVWADGTMDVYRKDGRRKQTSATPASLEGTPGAWRETFFDHTGAELTRAQINAVCDQARGRTEMTTQEDPNV